MLQELKNVACAPLNLVQNIEQTMMNKFNIPVQIYSRYIIKSENFLCYSSICWMDILLLAAMANGECVGQHRVLSTNLINVSNLRSFVYEINT